MMPTVLDHGVVHIGLLIVALSFFFSQYMKLLPLERVHHTKSKQFVPKNVVVGAVLKGLSESKNT